MNFEDAKLFAEPAQDRVADTLRASGGFANRVDDFARYDFELHFNNHTFRVEVKCEDRYAYTGNIHVEVQQGRGGKPSGIAFTEATVWVHTLGDNVVLYRQREMYHYVRDLYARGQYPYSPNGADNNNRGYNLVIDSLIQYDWFDYRRFQDLADSPIWNY